MTGVQTCALPICLTLAYISHRSAGGPVPRSVIVVHRLDNGGDHEIPLTLRRVDPVPLRWSPDGLEMLVRGADSHGRAGAFIVRVEGGAVSPGVLVPETHVTDVAQARWWIDGRSIAYVSPRGLVVRERGSQIERVMFDPSSARPPLRLVNFELASDGRSLAIAAVVSGTEPPVRELLVTALGGVPSAVTRAIFPNQVFLQTWMPDGRELLFTQRDARVAGPHALWRAPLDGVPRDPGIRIPGFTQINMIQVDPGGKRLAYTADQSSWDLWVLEHFLPGMGP